LILRWFQTQISKSNFISILFIWLILFHKQEAGWLSSFGYYGWYPSSRCAFVAVVIIQASCLMVLILCILLIFTYNLYFHCGKILIDHYKKFAKYQRIYRRNIFCRYFEVEITDGQFPSVIQSVHTDGKFPSVIPLWKNLDRLRSRNFWIFSFISDFMLSFLFDLEFLTYLKSCIS
jgi:hypothetical protein